MNKTPAYQSRESAAGLVVLSGVALFCLSLPIQVAAWEFRWVLHARFGWDEGELPKLTRLFVDVFGYRPDANLAAVVWWFFWPIVGSFGCCHFRYPEPAEFSAAFRHALLYCWSIFFCFLCVVLMICSLAFIILLAELHDPPWIANLIEPISWLLPAIAVRAVVATWQRSRGDRRG